jgi:hypothetical protein
MLQEKLWLFMALAAQPLCHEETLNHSVSKDFMSDQALCNVEHFLQ